ncbi:hypothetical protein ACOSQ3_006448 [Xanthoceras sorbifolium]
MDLVCDQKWKRKEGIVTKETKPTMDQGEEAVMREYFGMQCYEGCGKTFIDTGALRKHSHIHGCSVRSASSTPRTLHLKGYLVEEWGKVRVTFKVEGSRSGGGAPHRTPCEGDKLTIL